jgi:hypothetical protein
MLYEYCVFSFSCLGRCLTSPDITQLCQHLAMPWRAWDWLSPSLPLSTHSPKLRFRAATLSVLHAVTEAPRSHFLHGSESFQERKGRGLIIESRIFFNTTRLYIACRYSRSAYAWLYVAEKCFINEHWSRGMTLGDLLKSNKNSLATSQLQIANSHQAGSATLTDSLPMHAFDLESFYYSRTWAFWI